MTLIPIMIPLQTGQPLLVPDPGTGPRFFFDAQKRSFNIRIGLPVARQSQASLTQHGSLRKHSSGEARLYSRLGRQEIQRVASSVLLSRGRKTAIISSEPSLQKRTARQSTSRASLSQERAGKTAAQASVRKAGKSKTGSGVSLSQREKKLAKSETKLKRQKKNRAEARAESEDDTELLAALDE